MSAKRAARPRVVVRRVGGGLELRVDGTLASLYRPGHAVTGVVWWALAAPLLLVPGRNRPLRILLLGLGGGSVGRAVRSLAAEAEIVGVERDARIVSAARRHFDLDRLGLEVAVTDAWDYLRNERRRFDLIVEDVFVGTSRAVRKPDWLLSEGYPLVRRRLLPDGVFVSNTIHEMPAVVRAIRAMRPRLDRIVSLDIHGHWNRIVVGSRDGPGAAETSRRLTRHPAIAGHLSAIRVRTR